MKKEIFISKIENILREIKESGCLFIEKSLCEGCEKIVNELESIVEQCQK